MKQRTWQTTASKPSALIPFPDAKAVGKTVPVARILTFQSSLLLALNSILPGKHQQESVCLDLCAGMINRSVSDLSIHS